MSRLQTPTATTAAEEDQQDVTQLQGSALKKQPPLSLTARTVKTREATAQSAVEKWAALQNYAEQHVIPLNAQAHSDALKQRVLRNDSIVYQLPRVQGLQETRF